VLLRIGSIWYSSEMLLEERAIYTHPAYRKSSENPSRAAALVEFSKTLADGLGLPLSIGVLSSQRTEAKVRLYRRILGPATGAYWLIGRETGAVATGIT
jgi:hypothetical protein